MVSQVLNIFFIIMPLQKKTGNSKLFLLTVSGEATDIMESVGDFLTSRLIISFFQNAVKKKRKKTNSLIRRVKITGHLCLIPKNKGIPAGCPVLGEQNNL